MTDFADRASELEQADRDRALAAQARVAAAMRQVEAGGAECEDCGEPIEAGRRAALPTTRRCAQCARDAEQRNRGAPCRT